MLRDDWGAMIESLELNFGVALIVILFLLPIVPTNWLGTDAVYKLEDGTERKRVKFSLITSVIILITQPVNQLILNLSILFNFKTTIGLLIFSVVGVELFLKKQISQQAVVLVAISLIALYLEQLIEKAKRISIWKIFDWEAKSES